MRIQYWFLTTDRDMTFLRRNIDFTITPYLLILTSANVISSHLVKVLFYLNLNKGIPPNITKKNINVGCKPKIVPKNLNKPTLSYIDQVQAYLNLTFLHLFT